MCKITRITPPEELSPRIIARDSPRRSQEDSVRSAVHASVIRWRDLVLAAWELSDTEQYTGRLPEGMSSQQFWAKVTRQAKAMGGTVGIVVRGRSWWLWPGRRGVASGNASRSHRWSGIWKQLRADGAATVVGELSQRERKSIREVASRKGIRVRFAAEDGMTIVRRAEANKT
jgi:hypothetical protein